MIDCASRSVGDTTAIAAAIARLVRPGDIIALVGEMGAGKTVFARGFAAGLGVGADDHVASPTFNLVHVHDSGRVPLHHADLYRLETRGEIDDLGLREAADMGAVVLVEWGDALVDEVETCLVVELVDPDGGDAREITVSVEGHGWDARWERLRTALSEWVAA